MKQNKQPFKIYRNGRLDYKATYLPIAVSKLSIFGNKVDYFFVNNKWPTPPVEERGAPDA